MERCILSLLPAGPECEIILVNDGSTDETGDICDKYASKYPSIIKVIHQKNGGHGEGINTGVKHANGLYFKVVDSDDWADADSLKAVMAKLRELKSSPVDLLICNYVYTCESDGYKKPIKYANVFPQQKSFGWGDTRRFKVTQNLLMHSVFYKTDIIKSCGLVLPKHTFYVDNLFVYCPLPKVESIYYLNTDFYQYAIGRQDQSVNEKVMISNVDQQIEITKMLIKTHDVFELRKSNLKLSKYMTNYLAMMITVTSVLLILDGSTISLRKKKELWIFVKDISLPLYNKLRYFSLAAATTFPGHFGRKITLLLYRIARKVFRFN